MLSPTTVAGAFVPSYYGILLNSTENMHKFYKECSSLSWPGFDGEETTVSTLTGIQEKIMSSDFRIYPVEIEDVVAQRSPDGGIIVVVTGLSGGENLRRKFHQTFFLATQEGGFFLSNDILHFYRDDNQYLPFSSVSNAVPSTVMQTAASYAEAVAEDENVQVATGAVDLPVPTDIDTEVSSVPVPDTEAEVPETYDASVIDWEFI